MRRVGSVGPWSAEKLQLLRCYLGSQRGGFLPATKRARQRYYLDLFAGPGQNEIRGKTEVIDGSPLIALKAGPPRFDALVWVDADPDNVRSLEAHRQDYPDRKVTVVHGDVNDRIDEALAGVPRTFPVFAFLDPRGPELKWRTVRKLAGHKALGLPKIEVFILFAWNQAIVRLMPGDRSKMTPSAETLLDGFMPDTSDWRHLYARRVSGEMSSAEFRRLILDENAQGLRALGYKYVPSARLVKTESGRPLYFMIFASDLAVGERIMLWCLDTVRAAFLQQSFLPYDQQY